MKSLSILISWMNLKNSIMYKKKSAYKAGFYLVIGLNY